MENTGFIEETIQEKKLPEVDSCKVPLCSCTNHSTTNGLENCCKTGAFLVPLCVVI